MIFPSEENEIKKLVIQNVTYMTEDQDIPNEQIQIKE